MTVRARSLVSNSLSSIIASGLLIFSTVLIPAILVRAISRPDYDLLSIILVALPVLSIVPQSLRTAAASQLALAFNRAEQWLATRVYVRVSLLVILGLSILAITGIELYVYFNTFQQDRAALLRFGLYCVAGHALGLIAIGLFSGPAAAQRDFLPENFAKLWPGIYHLAGIAAVWFAEPTAPLVWICLVYLTSSWTAAALLALRLWGPLHARPERGREWRHEGVEALFWSGLRGTTWWNLTAYLATSVALLIVSLQHPASIVPFSIAFSVLGITSAGLIAVASPVSGYAVGMRTRDPAEQRRFFLAVNTAFQLYIAVMAAVVLLMPQQVFVWWLTPGLAGEVRLFCILLLPSFVLRLLTMGLTVFVMSAGRQETLWLSPSVEAVMSVLGCVLLGMVMGVAGIPLALAISAALRLMLSVVHDERCNAEALSLHRGDTLLSGLRLWRSR